MPHPAFEQWRRQAVAKPQLSIIIPAYNEYGEAEEEVFVQDRIRPTLAAIATTVSEFVTDWELIVSDDGSHDATADAVEKIGWANLRVLRSSNTGKGGAVKRGMLAARGNMLLFADADNSTPIEQLPKLIEQLEQGHDIAIGSRAAKGASVVNKSRLRKLGSEAINMAVKGFSGVRAADSQCGFKLFSREAAEAIFSRQTLEGFSFDIELLYLANRLGYSYVEVPITWYDAPGSKVKLLRDASRLMRDIMSIRLHDLRGGYNLANNKPLAQEAG